MSEVVSFARFTPPARFDTIPWEQVRIEEAATEDGPWTAIDTLAITPDVDPSDPAAQSFTTTNGTATDLWYRVIFVDGVSNETEPTRPRQNKRLSTAIAEESYASTDELARILHIRQPSVGQTPALERVLKSAALEINAEIGRGSPFANPAPALVVEVNLERAVEHWQQEEAAFGIVGLGSDTGAVYTARDSWDRHAHKLAPLKESWGIG